MDSAAQRFIAKYGGTLYQAGALTGVRTAQGTIIPSLVSEDQWASTVDAWKRQGYMPNPVLAAIASSPLAVPLQGLYALGGAINTLTGGKTQTYNAQRAIRQGVDPGSIRYSTFTQAASGYQGSTPNNGNWQLPVLNKSTGKVVHQVSDAALGAVGLPSLTTLLLLAGGGLLGLGAIYVATR